MTIIRSLPIDDYHASPCISASKLKVFLRDGPLAFHDTFVAKTLPREDKACYLFGRAYDDLSFDAPAFHHKYAVRPEGIDLRTAAGKAWKEENAGREIITADEYATMLDMLKAVGRNALAAQLLSAGEAQVSLRRELPALGLTLQGRPDWIHLDQANPYLLDLKTCDDIEAFHRMAIPYGYHIQMAIAQWIAAGEGYQCPGYLLAVEKRRSGRARVYRIPETALAAGWQIVKDALTEIAERTRSGVWSESQAEAIDIELPTWQMKQLEAVGA